MRTTPNIAAALQAVEEVIVDKLIPKLTGRNVDHVERELFSLQARYGGLGIINPTAVADLEYDNSLQATEQLVHIAYDPKPTNVPLSRHGC